MENSKQLEKVNEPIVIYKGATAKELFGKGFELININSNKKYPERTVFYFKNEKEIREYLKENHPEILKSVPL